MASTQNSSQNNSSDISQENLNDTVTGFQNLEELRISGLDNSALLIDINSEILAIEQKRLVAKYRADDQRVISITAKLASMALLRDGLDKEIIRSSQKPIALGADNLSAVQGIVYDPSGKPLPNTTVYIGDANGQLLSDKSTACSDDRGYYSIGFDKDLLKAMKSRPFYVKASDSNKNVIYSDSIQLALTPGKVIPKNIFITGKVCTPPPAATAEDNKTVS